MPTIDKPAMPFVTTVWLASHLGNPDLQVIDGSWYLPTQNRNGRDEFGAGHIPGAIFFDIDALSDQTTDLPHMLLDDASFAREAGRIGISSDGILVVYDGVGLFSAPRVWWTLHLYGARKVFILEGGLPRWKAEGRSLEHGASLSAPAVFSVQRSEDRVADLRVMRQVLANGSAQVVDARPAARFKGEAPEPRPGIDSGHMPGSINLPFSAVVSEGALHDADALRQTFADAGVDLEMPVVVSCGSGVSAAILVVAMETLGKHDAVLYDGSWAEYASQPDTVIETG